LSSKYT